MENTNNIKKFIAEFIGTMVLVIMGCGTAMLCNPGTGSGYILTALAFGLTIVGMAYCVGNVSGCHINPAVSLAFLLNGDMSVKEFIGYIISQILGALAGAGLLALIFSFGGVLDNTYAIGSNSLAGVNNSFIAGLLVEIILTFIFVLTILGVTSKESNKSVSGIVIGLTLALVHILGIGLTGTSVNPARSIGPAFMTYFASNNGEYLICLWVFIAGPVAGSLLAVLVNKIFKK